MNPEKCSLTIGKLAQLQRLIRAEGLRDRVNLAAFTYDPAFDTPDRLHAYGHARGMAYDGRNKLIRTCGPFAPVQQHFELGVGFGSATVNRHRIELLVLHRSLRIRNRFVRLQWREADVLARLKAALRA
jgi:cytochrome oxidase Cu insertion factor (SCO1/SenC/PrrC family)